MRKKIFNKISRREFSGPTRPWHGGYMAIFLILTPDGALLVSLLVLQSAQLGFVATFLPPRVSADKKAYFNGL